VKWITIVVGCLAWLILIANGILLVRLRRQLREGWKRLEEIEATKAACEGLKVEMQKTLEAMRQ